MAVLSYRVRRFIRRNVHWNTCRFHWNTVGLGMLVTALGVAFAPMQIPFLSATFSFFAAYIALSFLLSAWVLPNPTEYLWAVRKYDDIRDWWKKVSQPAYIGTFEGKSVLKRCVFYDFRYIYDHTGRLIATEQTINWSDTDPNWRPGDEHDVEIIVNRYDKGEGLPWLARLRSPKIG
jgi:hypothetical protein